jgi:hypothetical protein
MNLLPHIHQRDFETIHFGENRKVYFLGFTAAGNAMKGVWNGIKGAPKQVKEKAGWFMKGVDWITTAKTPLGYVMFGPLIVTRKLVGGVADVYNGVNGAALALGTKIGSIINKPVHDVVDLTREVVEQTLKAAYGCTVKPSLEILKSVGVDFPMRALVDNFRTGLKTIFGTIGSFGEYSIDAVKQTFLSPLTIVKATRDAVKSALWEAPKALIKGEFGSFGKHLAEAPLTLGKGVLKAPLSIAAVPYHTSMELGLGGLETVMNASRAVAAPFEGLVNAHRAIGDAGEDALDYLKEKLQVHEAGAYRQRLRDIFSMTSPFAGAAAAAT